jgi:hypothetical protein
LSPKEKVFKKPIKLRDNQNLKDPMESKEKPFLKRPEFAEPFQPCYDYRNMENAGKFRGVGQAGKIGLFDGKESIDTMAPKPEKRKVRRDHEG